MAEFSYGFATLPVHEMLCIGKQGFAGSNIDCLSQFTSMNKKIQSALISVFYKDGLESIVKLVSDLGISIYSTGGTQEFI